jgi:hypothetical protein
VNSSEMLLPFLSLNVHFVWKFSLILLC